MTELQNYQAALTKSERRVRLLDRLLIGCALGVILLTVVVACTSSANADDSRFPNLDAIHERQLQMLESRVAGVEVRVQSAEERLQVLEREMQKGAVFRPQNQQALSQQGASQQARQAPPPVKQYWTQQELEAWVKERYSPDSTLQNGVMARGQERLVYQHLMSGNHGFRPEQVLNLPQWVALALHDAHHGGLIDPVKSTTPQTVTTPAVARSTGSSTDGVPARISGNWLHWVADGVRWSNLGTGVREGQIYRGSGRSWVYQQGRIYEQGSSVRGAPDAQPSRQSPQQVRVLNSNCPDGRCNRNWGPLTFRN